MKRTMLAAVLVVAMVFGVIAYANAETAVVTAKVNPAISLTITEDVASGDWSALDPGTSPSDKIFNFEVKSNKPWDFTWDSTVYAPDDTLLDAILSESKVASFFDIDDLAIPKGVSTTTVNYALDMTLPAAYQLDPDPATYTATYTYSAVFTP